MSPLGEISAVVNFVSDEEVLDFRIIESELTHQYFKCPEVRLRLLDWLTPDPAELQLLDFLHDVVLMVVLGNHKEGGEVFVRFFHYNSRSHLVRRILGTVELRQLLADGGV